MIKVKEEKKIELRDKMIQSLKMNDKVTLVIKHSDNGRIWYHGGKRNKDGSISNHIHKHSFKSGVEYYFDSFITDNKCYIKLDRDKDRNSYCIVSVDEIQYPWEKQDDKDLSSLYDCSEDKLDFKINVNESMSINFKDIIVPQYKKEYDYSIDDYVHTPIKDFRWTDTEIETWKKFIEEIDEEEFVRDYSDYVNKQVIREIKMKYWSKFDDYSKEQIVK